MTEREAREQAGRDWDRLTAEDYQNQGVSFRREYPCREEYVEEWWHERYCQEETTMNIPDPRVYFQISRRYRTVARLSEGKTGKQALAECGGQRCDDLAWIEGMGGASAGNHYLRCYSPEEDQLQLTREEFAEFRRRGGETYSIFVFKEVRRIAEEAKANAQRARFWGGPR